MADPTVAKGIEERRKAARRAEKYTYEGPKGKPKAPAVRKGRKLPSGKLSGLSFDQLMKRADIVAASRGVGKRKSKREAGR